MDVSIVVTTHNYEAYLKECLDSCLYQDPSALKHEVIVVDDGSTDQTPAILDKISHPQLRKFRIANAGIEAASNYGFKMAGGTYIVRVDADDKLTPHYLKDMAPYLSSSFGFVYPDYTIIDSRGTIVEPVNLPEFEVQEVRSRGDFLATGTMYVSKLVEGLGGYATLVKNSGLENYELILRLIASNVKGRHVPRHLFYYRRHSLNLSETKRTQIIQNGERLFSRMGLGSFRTNQHHPYKLRLP